jgi:hypothetical protein
VTLVGLRAGKTDRDTVSDYVMRHWTCGRKLKACVLTLTAVALVCAIIVIWYCKRDYSLINAVSFGRVKPGMTLSEVEAVLGGPTRDESTGPTQIDLPESATREEIAAARQMLADCSKPRPGTLVWRANTAVGQVEFDHNLRVTGAAWLPVRRARELDILDRLCHELDVIVNGYRK